MWRLVGAGPSRDGQNGAIASKAAGKTDTEAKGNERGKSLAASLPKPRGPPVFVKKRKFDDSGGTSTEQKRGATAPLGGVASAPGADVPLAVAASNPAQPSGGKVLVNGGDSGSEGGGLAGLLGGYGSSDSDQ